MSGTILRVLVYHFCVRGSSITEPCVKFELKLSLYLVLIES